eukprot:5525-Heterococcus_DN1.PRE.1
MENGRSVNIQALKYKHLEHVLMHLKQLHLPFCVTSYTKMILDKDMQQTPARLVPDRRLQQVSTTLAQSCQQCRHSYYATPINPQSTSATHTAVASISPYCFSWKAAAAIEGGSSRLTAAQGADSVPVHCCCYWLRCFGWWCAVAHCRTTATTIFNSSSSSASSVGESTEAHSSASRAHRSSRLLLLLLLASVQVRAVAAQLTGQALRAQPRLVDQRVEAHLLLA